MIARLSPLLLMALAAPLVGAARPAPAPVRALPPAAPAPDPNGATPGAVLAAAPARDWQAADPADLLLIELADGARVTMLLAPGFAPRHVASIRALARAHWYDGIVVERVQDNYVVQWGDPDGKKPLPAGVPAHPPAEYERPAKGLAPVALPYRDTYAPRVGFVGAFPVAVDGARAWLTHCYAMVGVGRDLSPDTGSGGELYAVNGQPARALDRNVALVGRIVDGFDALTALPRGGGEMGFYRDPAQRKAIARVRVVRDLPVAERPAVQWLKPDSASFRKWLEVRANRHDAFFLRPAGAVDLCNALPPVRTRPPRG